MCKKRFSFTDEELKTEHKQWTQHIRTHIPDPYPGIHRVIQKQKELGGKIIVVSHSDRETILRDYETHFGILPDAVYGFDLPPEQRKPNPFPLLDIMEKFHFQPEEILVVDDANLACQMADPLGIKVAFPAWSKLGMDIIIEEMSKLCAYTFHTPGQLEDFLFSAD